MFVPWGILSLVTLTILIITTTNVEPKHAISNYNNSDHQISGFLNGRTFCLLPVSREALWEACDIALASPKTLWRNKSKCQGLFHLALSFFFSITWKLLTTNFPRPWPSTVASHIRGAGWRWIGSLFCRVQWVDYPVDLGLPSLWQLYSLLGKPHPLES